MQIVIDIPKTIYEEMMETAIMVTEVYPSTIERALTEGIPYEERKTGKWYCDMYGVFRCGSCGKSAHLDSRGRAWLDRYCSWCGAKMEADDD